ncbi:hypothetical protein [Paenibacillus sanguinis]|uniref:hypothetical protein n=1 Tax=Paenibacillus sanguinis TaxID=225906 RepID=UPI0012B5C597|nr:hypothetical protein [Paenibacillus sanguinis]
MYWMIPLGEQLLTFGKSGAEANVRTGVGAGVVQVEREHPGISAIVPIAAANR